VKAEILESIALYEKTGFCASLGGWYSDVSAVGVPLKLNNGPFFAFNCGGPSYRMSRDKLMNDIGPRLVALAAEVRRTLEAGRITQLA
jgi:DNA-binding IclR family transcriptional regulator